LAAVVMMQFPGYGYKKYINRLTIRQSVKAESDQTCPFQAIRQSLSLF